LSGSAERILENGIGRTVSNADFAPRQSAKSLLAAVI
jgi:hypothetical protein